MTMGTKWNTRRLGIFGFLLGAVSVEVMTFLHPDAELSRMPIPAVILAGLIGLLFFGGAAMGRNRLVRPMTKFPELQNARFLPKKKWNAARLGILGFMFGAVSVEVVTFLHPDAGLSRIPTASAFFSGVMGLLVFGGAAIGRNRFVMQKPAA